MKKIIFILSTIALIACKNGEKATKDSEMKTSNEQIDPKDDPTKSIVSFISIGTGIDHKLKTKFLESLAKFNEENKTSLEPEIRHWGREGEIDMIFDMKNLSTKQRNSFSSFVKETIGDSELVNFKE